jgi:hypothetical protein
MLAQALQGTQAPASAGLGWQEKHAEERQSRPNHQHQHGKA